MKDYASLTDACKSKLLGIPASLGCTRKGRNSAVSQGTGKAFACDQIIGPGAYWVPKELLPLS